MVKISITSVCFKNSNAQCVLTGFTIADNYMYTTKLLFESTCFCNLFGVINIFDH